MIRTEPSDHVHLSSRTPIGQTPLTKREYFAGLAMQGILASKNTPEDATYGEIVFDAVTLADTLINELNKNK